MQAFRTGDGCRLAYRLDGPEGAPVLLMSNSLGTSMDLWAPQLDTLTQRYRLLRYDSRGHGKSDVPAGSYSIDRLGRDVIELLDVVALDQVAFCGLSLGGMVGQWLGIRAPERVSRLILSNTSSYMGPPDGWDSRIEAAVGNGMSAIADAVLERWFTPAFRAANSPLLTVVRDQLLSTDPLGYAGCCAAIRDMDMRRVCQLITVPTLIIAGDADPATPLPHAEALAESIAGSVLKIVHAAHLSNVELPDAFAETVLDFLKP